MASSSNQTATELFHGTPQAQRIQKRLVLNRSFKLIQQEAGALPALTYVTLGGEHLFDVLDLLYVFDVGKFKLRVLSYEDDANVVEVARRCPVARTLTKVPTVEVEIVPRHFPSGISAYRRSEPFIYFLDYLCVFREPERQTVESLLTSGMLKTGDFLIVTSCLTPRVAHQEDFMAEKDSMFSLLYGRAPTKEFKARNFVDLQMGMTIMELQSQTWRDPAAPTLRLLSKTKYRDSKAPMGVWLYAVEDSEERLMALEDVPFDEFPHAFTYVAPPAVPNIFD